MPTPNLANHLPLHAYPHVPRHAADSIMKIANRHGQDVAVVDPDGVLEDAVTFADELVRAANEAQGAGGDERKKPTNLDEALDHWSVMAPGMWENDSGPKGWHAVCNDDGIVAYFAQEKDAFRYRLDAINRDLNP